MRVLVVDDEEIIRSFLIRLLSLQGLEVVGVEDGHRAIEIAKKEKFDLFFIDMRMPGINGLETYRQLRKIEPQAKVVMITGYAVEDLLEQALKEGVAGIIRKPFDIQNIKGIIDRFVQEERKELLNILVIDDEDVILDFFANLLRTKNLRYKLTHNRTEALDAAKKEKFNLIFLDVVLKDISGIELYKEIQEILPEAVIVLMTGYPEKAKEIGGDIYGCLYKPFDIASILGHIERVRTRQK